MWGLLKKMVKVKGDKFLGTNKMRIIDKFSWIWTIVVFFMNFSNSRDLVSLKNFRKLIYEKYKHNLQTIEYVLITK